MSWLYSQALAEEYLGATYSDGEPFAQLNVMPTQHKFWRNDKTMEFSSLSRFGLTLRLLTEQDGEALLISYLEAFPAKTSALQGKEMESQEVEADYGPKCAGWFAKYDPASCLWKTAQCSLLADSEEYSETWPRTGMTRTGCAYQRANLGHPTSATESGSWPTPTASASKGSSPATLVRKNGRSRINDRLDHAIMHHHGGQLNPDWTEWLMGWPIGWTALEPLEMGKFQEWRQNHLSGSGMDGNDA